MIWRILRKFLFSLDPEWAHALGGFFLRCRGFFTQGRAPRVQWFTRKAPRFLGMELDSPLGIAAGFDKDGTLVLGLKSLGFGFVEVGSVTPKPQPGNPRPRVFRIPEARALINRMGFNSQGADRVAERLRELRAMAHLGFPLGVNLGKNKETPLEEAGSDYVYGIERLYDVADYLVVNLSSPNTPGLTDLQEAAYLEPLLKKAREARDAQSKRLPGPARPLFLKLSPDLLPEARRMAVDTALAVGFEGIIASNTSRRRDLPGLIRVSPVLLAEDGGLSGAPLGAEALEVVLGLRKQMGPKPTLISVGGLGGPQDARARLEAGADLLQVYTEFIYGGPSYPLRMARALAKP